MVAFKEVSAIVGRNLKPILALAVLRLSHAKNLDFCIIKPGCIIDSLARSFRQWPIKIVFSGRGQEEAKVLRQRQSIIWLITKIAHDKRSISM